MTLRRFAYWVRGLLVLVAIAGTVWGFLTIRHAGDTPNYDRRVRASSGIETEGPSRVVLVTNQSAPVNSLRATLSERGSRTEYYADGLAGETVWFLLLGDARLPGVGGITGETESGVPGLKVSYQLVSRSISGGDETGFAAIRGRQPVGPSVGASAWQFAAPTLDVSCDRRDRSLLRRIAEEDAEFPPEFAESCADQLGADLRVTVLTEGDERISTDSGPVQPPGTDQRQFVTSHSAEQRGFEFTVSSATDASHNATEAAVAGVVVGVTLAFLVQGLWEALRWLSRTTAPTPRPARQSQWKEKLSPFWVAVVFLVALASRRDHQRPADRARGH